MYHNYWVRKDEVGIINDEEIREGKIRHNAALLTLSGEPLTDKIESYILVEAYNDEYLQFDAAGNVDVAKVKPITFDSFNNTYVALGESVAKAFNVGSSLK